MANEIIKKSQDYLHLSTTQAGGVLYRGSQGCSACARPLAASVPALTAAAIATCGFSAGDYNSETVKKWFKYCKDKIGFGVAANGHDDYTQYYYAQAVYMLGDEGWEKLFGATPQMDRLTWTTYRDHMFKFLAGNQNQDGELEPARRLGRRPRVLHRHQPQHHAIGQGHAAHPSALIISRLRLGKRARPQAAGVRP